MKTSPRTLHSQPPVSDVWAPRRRKTHTLDGRPIMWHRGGRTGGVVRPTPLSRHVARQVALPATASHEATGLQSHPRLTPDIPQPG